MSEPLVLEVVTTRLDAEAAEVTVQYLPNPLTAVASEFTLQGTLTGPWRRDVEPGPENYPLIAVSSEDGFVRCRGVIPAPAFWSPAAPQLYRAQVQLQRGTESSACTLEVGFKTLTLSRKTVTLNEEPTYLKGVRLEQAVEDDLFSRLRQAGINLLLVPLELGHVARLADRQGFLVLYRVNPQDEPLLWEAEAKLFNHVSTLGFVLPHGVMREPQLWHNAMLHLHHHRRDVYVGVQIEEVPVGLIQGHVDFLLVSQPNLGELMEIKTAKFALVRRPDLGPEDLPAGLVGHISRVLPVE